MSLAQTIDISLDFDLNLFPKPLVFIDLETRGGKKGTDAIIEIALIRVATGESPRAFSSLIHADHAGTLQHIHQITNYHLAFAPEFQEVLSVVRELCEDAIMVAHKAIFEEKHLRDIFQQLGGDWNVPHLCTLNLAKKVFPQRKGRGAHSMQGLVTFLSLEPIGHMHCAMTDALLLIPLLGELIKRDAPSSRMANIQASMKTYSQPTIWPNGREGNRKDRGPQDHITQELQKKNLDGMSRSVQEFENQINRDKYINVFVLLIVVGICLGVLFWGGS